MNEQQVEQWKPPADEMPLATVPGAVTHAQSRTDAVATTFNSAMSRASTLELSAEQAERLKAPFDDGAIEFGAGGDSSLAYIEHAHLRDRLNDVLGMGRWACIRLRPHWAEPFEYFSKTNKRREQGTRVYADCALLVHGALVGEAIGSMDYYPNQQTNYGDAAEGAMSNAFRRCCKHFGVGLQTWKKSELRALAARKGEIMQGQQAPRPAATATPTPPAAPAPQARPAATAQQVTGGATPKTREWMLAKLGASFSALDVQKYAVEMKLIPAGGVLSSDWSLSAVPSTGPGLRELMSKIQGWIENQKTGVDPDAPPAEDDIPLGAPVGDDIDTEAWGDVIITVPPAGVKKVAYMQAPDTIRELYHKMKAGDEAARTRLWGMAKMWTPQPWVGQDGATRQPSAADLLARASLDTFVEWHDAKEGK